MSLLVLESVTVSGALTTLQVKTSVSLSGSLLFEPSRVTSVPTVTV